MACFYSLFGSPPTTVKCPPHHGWAAASALQTGIVSSDSAVTDRSCRSCESLQSGEQETLEVNTKEAAVNLCKNYRKLSEFSNKGAEPVRCVSLEEAVEEHVSPGMQRIQMSKGVRRWRILRDRRTAWWRRLALPRAWGILSVRTNLYRFTKRENEAWKKTCQGNCIKPQEIKCFHN